MHYKKREMKDYSRECKQSKSTQNTCIFFENTVLSIQAQCHLQVLSKIMVEKDHFPLHCASGLWFYFYFCTWTKSPLGLPN